MFNYIGGYNSIFVCPFCEHFAKNRGWTDINVHKSAHKILTFQPVQTKRGVSHVFKNIPNHSLCDLHTILNEHTSIISIQEPSKSAKNNFCLFLSVDFVNILPKSGGEQTKIELDPPIYLAECITCESSCVGYSRSNLPKHFSNHKSYIKRNIKSCRLANHELGNF